VSGEERLRRYLEQRRDLGEREWVLDALDVEDVLRILGARSTDGRRAAAASPEAPYRVDTPPAPPARRALVAADPPTASSPSIDITALSSLDDVADAARACRRCGLAMTAKRAVPGMGHTRAPLMCVGEAPGADEDASGEPFVGKAGQLLTKILAAIRLAREDVFIGNIIKHRPPGNRDPQPDEVAACLPLLQRQITLVQPHAILALGRIAAQALLGTSQPLSALRGAVHDYRGIPVVVTYHPAALLRNEAWKRPTWQDVQMVRRLLDERQLPAP
jgi:DNA polymerase